MIVYEKKIDLNTNSYDVIDQTLITSRDFVRTFGTIEDYVEAHVYDSSGNRILNSNYNYTKYKIPASLKGEEVTTTEYLEFSPGAYIESLGYFAGRYIVTFNVLRKKIVNINKKVFFIKTISADRTELLIQSNEVSDSQVQEGVLNFIEEFQSSLYYKDFLLNFGDNKLVNAVNIALNTNTNPYSILVKLYKPLPKEFSEKSSFWFSEELSSPISFEVEVTPEIVSIPTPFLKSANFNIEVDYKANSLSDYYNNSDITKNDSLFSYQELINKLKNKGIAVSVNYEDYSDFVHFSSATRRLENFLYKLKNIESYTYNLSLITDIPNYTGSYSTSQSAYEYQKTITDIVSNFDGYENFLYYESSSKSWPKSGSSKPYKVVSTSDPEALSWYGSLDYDNPFYGGQLYSASSYDNENRDGLVYSIPEYIRIEETNKSFDLFIEMMGEYFDSIWIYIKSITDLYKNNNFINRGISKDLVYYALRSLGIKLYNSKANEDLYSYLIGANVSGSYTLQSDGYSTYITASSTATPGQDIQKEILKRIYHNVPSLLKKKGTNDGLQELISIFGIPYTVLSPNQFGGADKTNETAEYVYDRFSYSLYNTTSSYISIPWDSLYAVPNPSVDSFVPDSIELRFKPDKKYYYRTASLIEVVPVSSTNRSFGVVVRPDLSKGEPYSKVEFYLRGNQGVYSSSVSLPIYSTDFSGDTYWWNLLLTRSDHTSGSQISTSQTYSLIVANKIDDRVGHRASSSIYVDGAASSSYNSSWSDSDKVLYVGGSQLSSDGNFLPSYKFIGSLQELRYWTTPISQSTFFYHTLNPESIQGNISSSAYDNLVARFPLGNDLKKYDHTLVTKLKSVHPNYKNRLFYDVSTDQSASFVNYLTDSYLPNVETYVADSPNSVYSNPVNQKIRIVNNQITGSVLSNLIRLEDTESVYRTRDVHFTDISFSPQNEINKDIISQYGGTIDLDQYIGDPRDSNKTIYPNLDTLNKQYYSKYINRYNLKDYTRLIQFYDNALFKMILDFIPGRDNVSTGLTIKSPILERPKAKTVQLGGDPIYNYIDSYISSSKIEADSIYISGVSDGRDFYTGELSGSIIDINNIFSEKNRNPYL